MSEDPFAPDYWNKALDRAEAAREVTPRWRWLKRSGQLEGIRMLRQFAIAENRAHLAELRRKLGREDS